MAFETLNLILSTALSITFMQCCKIVLMFYNEKYMWRLVLRLRQADIYTVLSAFNF